MEYRSELDYLCSVLHKLNLQTLRMTPDNLYRLRPDFGLRKFLGLEGLYEYALRQVPNLMQPNVIHRVTDDFLCNYIFLPLPQTQGEFLVIGPYLAFRVSREQLLEQAERYGVSAKRFSRFEACFAEIPVLADDTALYALLSSFGELLWGKGSAFHFLDTTLESPGILPETLSDDITQDPEEIALNMQAMEKRYAYENELMENVSQGLSSRAERMIRHLPTIALDQRAADPVRNVKNYCIVCNTLLRKAAEKGGVHPLLLDRYSAALARKAELITQIEMGTEMMCEMVRTYCRLVRQHAIGRYPPLVQKTLTYIDANYSGSLSLPTLAAAHNVSESYLSSLFHREYGKTITEYVLERRMDAAVSLLLTTHLQVQTIAQHCGFSDVNYFSKVFKKIHGLTPRQFRERRSAASGH